ncbi:uncharacterized protein LOC143178534 [Calliopsis andreniformis]|uniref:uncharacterized protein LOC143178534 n=1 Tax=Calliopsis andreniformis TaxID=337506 RepID=UPI003FCD4836
MNFIGGLHHFLRCLGTAIESSERERRPTSVTTNHLCGACSGWKCRRGKIGPSARAPRARQGLTTTWIVRNAFVRTRSTMHRSPRSAFAKTPVASRRSQCHRFLLELDPSGSNSSLSDDEECRIQFLETQCFFPARPPIVHDRFDEVRSAFISSH